MLIALAAVYVVWFTDWFKPKRMAVFHTSRSLSAGRWQRGAGGAGGPVLMFGLDRDYRLTKVKVVSLEEYRTNLLAIPLWHLVSDSNSAPVRAFSYGQNIRGMKPSIKGNLPQPLETNRLYRMFITAGQVSGEHDFMPGGPIPPPAGSAN